MAEAPLRVLVVDDEAPARRRLRDVLDDCSEAMPIVVVGEAAGGREAIEMLQAVSADLVLTDIRMPGMDGLELARHLLKLPQPPLVIFTTAYHEHALEAFDVNAIDYLVKPVRVARLLAALQKLPRLKPLSATRLDQMPANARRFLSVTERSRVVLVPIEEVVYLKAEYVDAVYLQQDAFDAVDGASSAERQRHVFAQVARVLVADLDFGDKDVARGFFQGLTQVTRDWNRTAMDDPAFAALEERLDAMLAEAAGDA